MWLGGRAQLPSVDKCRTGHSSGLFDSVQLQLLRQRTGGFRADDLPAVWEQASQIGRRMGEACDEAAKGAVGAMGDAKGVAEGAMGRGQHREGADWSRGTTRNSPGAG